MLWEAWSLIRLFFAKILQEGELANLLELFIHFLMQFDVESPLIPTRKPANNRRKDRQVFKFLRRDESFAIFTISKRTLSQ